MMTIGKRLMALAVLLACLAALTACGGAAESPQAPTAFRFNAVPEEAFGNDGRAVIAGTPDGSRLLISGGYALYIWDAQAQKKIPLTFSREEDLEYLDMKIRTAAVFCSPAYSRLKKDQRAAFEEKTAKQADDYLASKGLTRFESLEQAQECYDHIIPIAGRCTGLSDSFALVECSQLGIEIVTDLRTGESRLIGTDPERRDAQIPSVICGDRLFCRDGLLRLGTWESDYPAENYYFPTYADFDNPPDDISYMRTAVLLPDDSILFTSSGMFDRENGTTGYLAHRSAQKSTVTDLGRFPGMSVPDRLLVTGNGRYVMAYIANRFDMPKTVVNLETMEIRETESQMFFFAACETGFIGYDLRETSRDINVILLDPETMTTRVLQVLGDPWQVGSMTAVGGIVNNGQGVLFNSYDALHGYFTLE